MAISEDKLQTFMGQLINDLSGGAMTASVTLGERLGLYKAMVDGEPVTADDVADRTGCHPRLVREWLNAQVAAGYLEHADGTYRMPEEHALALAIEDSPVYVAGGAATVGTFFIDMDRQVDAMRGDGAVAWGDHHHSLFSGTEAFFRPGYKANLVTAWLPALDGVVQKLQSGGTVADVGCGHGASTIVMAEAFPASTFVGYDLHGPSIDTARKRASDAGVADRVRFQEATATGYDDSDFDLVCFFDCLHDMGDPVGAATHARQRLADDGTVLLVEPFAGDRLEENMTPVGRLFYAASTFVCTPNSLSQDAGRGLGAQAGEAQLRDVMTEAGFTRFRRATETPFNLILEARP